MKIKIIKKKEKRKLENGKWQKPTAKMVAKQPSEKSQKLTKVCGGRIQ